MASVRQLISYFASVPFIRTVATMQITTAINVVVGFASSIVYIRLLGLELFGILAVVYAFSGLLSIPASFGQDTALVTFFSEAVGGKDTHKAKAVLWYFLQSTVLSTVMYVVLGIIAPSLATVWQSNGEIGHYARYVFANQALQGPAVLLFLGLQIERKLKLLSLVENARTILQFAITTVMLMLNMGIMAILLGTLIISIIYVPICLFLYERLAKNGGKMPRLTSLIRSGKSSTKAYFLQGLMMTLDRSIASNLHPNIFIMMIASISTEMAGVLRLALRLAYLPTSLLLPSITRTASVSLPKLIAQDRKALKSSVLKLLTGCIILSIILVVGGEIVIPPLIPIVYGKEFISTQGPFMILIISTIFISLNVITVPLLRTYKKLHVSIINFLVGILIGVALFFVLIKFMSPILAVSIGIVYVHAHSLLMYPYLWISLRNSPTGSLEHSAQSEA